MPALDPGGPNGTSLTTPVLIWPSPQATVAVCVSAVPASLKVAPYGSTWPSSIVNVSPASTTGATLFEVTVNVVWPTAAAPSSSVTNNCTVYTPLSAYTWLALSKPCRPSTDPGGPNGVSVRSTASRAEPSPHSMNAVCVASVPASENVAGARLTFWPSITVWCGPAVTTGAAFSTVTRKASSPTAPSSSVTRTVTVYTPLSAYTCVADTLPCAPRVNPGGPNGVSVTEADWLPVPSPQSIVAMCVSRVPLSLNVTSSTWTTWPSVTLLFGPASTVAATFATVTRSVLVALPPSSSARVPVMLYEPLSA